MQDWMVVLVLLGVAFLGWSVWPWQISRADSQSFLCPILLEDVLEKDFLSLFHRSFAIDPILAIPLRRLVVLGQMRVVQGDNPREVLGALEQCFVQAGASSPDGWEDVRRHLVCVERQFQPARAVAQNERSGC